VPKKKRKKDETYKPGPNGEDISPIYSKKLRRKYYYHYQDANLYKYVSKSIDFAVKSNNRYLDRPISKGHSRGHSKDNSNILTDRDISENCCSQKCAKEEAISIMEAKFMDTKPDGPVPLRRSKKFLVSGRVEGPKPDPKNFDTKDSEVDRMQSLGLKFVDTETGHHSKTNQSKSSPNDPFLETNYFDAEHHKPSGFDNIFSDANCEDKPDTLNTYKSPKIICTNYLPIAVECHNSPTQNPKKSQKDLLDSLIDKSIQTIKKHSNILSQNTLDQGQDPQPILENKLNTFISSLNNALLCTFGGQISKDNLLGEIKKKSTGELEPAKKMTVENSFKNILIYDNCESQQKSNKNLGFDRANKKMSRIDLKNYPTMSSKENFPTMSSKDNLGSKKSAGSDFVVHNSSVDDTDFINLNHMNGITDRDSTENIRQLTTANRDTHFSTDNSNNTSQRLERSHKNLDVNCYPGMLDTDDPEFGTLAPKCVRSNGKKSPDKAKSILFIRKQGKKLSVRGNPNDKCAGFDRKHRDEDRDEYSSLSSCSVDSELKLICSGKKQPVKQSHCPKDSGGISTNMNSERTSDNPHGKSSSSYLKPQKKSQEIHPKNPSHKNKENVPIMPPTIAESHRSFSEKQLSFSKNPAPSKTAAQPNPTHQTNFNRPESRDSL
jgi:hypothetical protein